MIDAKAVRTNPDAMREAIRVRKVDPAKANVDRWLALDAARQKLQRDIDADHANPRMEASVPCHLQQSPGTAAHIEHPLQIAPGNRFHGGLQRRVAIRSVPPAVVALGLAGVFILQRGVGLHCAVPFGFVFSFNCSKRKKLP